MVHAAAAPIRLKCQSQLELYAARTCNPVAAALGVETLVRVARRDSWRGYTWVKCEAEMVEPEARMMLEDFLVKRLIPLGGAEVGRKQGKTSVFRLNGIGRYYIGTATEFTDSGLAALGRVIVQPNFEIVILGQNLLAEVELAAFCERTGESSGAVFRITRKSVQQALHQGGTVEGLLATLRRLSDRDLPPNVATEISGWSESRKTYRLTTATLIRCPDATVAARLHGRLPATTVPLNDTTLELTGRITAPQSRKLEAAGLFLDAGTVKPPPPRRKRRGGWTI